MIKKFNEYLMESEGTLTQKQKNWLDRRTSGTWRVNSSTGLVDVDGSLYCSNSGIKTLQGVRFGVVSENFYCSHNQLTSLEGAPQEVEEDFYCTNNQLTSLKGAPQKVGRDFSCYDNKLTSLEGAPQEVEEDFSCSYNQLTSLEGSPQEIGGDFFCFNNQLASLKGIPFVNGDINLGQNPIWNLIFSHWKQIEDMKRELRNLVMQMIGQLETPKTEDIARIVRSVERMDMI